MADNGERIATAAERMADALEQLARELAPHFTGGPISDKELEALAMENKWLQTKRFANGTIAAVAQFAFTYAIISEVTRGGYGRRWCFHDRQACLCALDDWEDVYKSPEGWHRAVHTGERRDENGNFLGVW